MNQLPAGGSEPHADRRSVKNADERLHLLLEAVTDYAIFLLDPDGYVLTWNPGAERMKGYQAHEIIGQHFSCFYPPEAVQTKWPAQELRIATEQGRFEEEGGAYARTAPDSGPTWS